MRQLNANLDAACIERQRSAIERGRGRVIPSVSVPVCPIDQPTSTPQAPAASGAASAAASGGQIVFT